jgi:hypothetical protein
MPKLESGPDKTGRPNYIGNDLSASHVPGIFELAESRATNARAASNALARINKADLLKSRPQLPQRVAPVRSLAQPI